MLVKVGKYKISAKVKHLSDTQYRVRCVDVTQVLFPRRAAIILTAIAVAILLGMAIAGAMGNGIVFDIRAVDKGWRAISWALLIAWLLVINFIAIARGCYKDAYKKSETFSTNDSNNKEEMQGNIHSVATTIVEWVEKDKE